MKKNRIRESELLNSAEKTLCRGPVKDIPVFLVLGLCILAINVFPCPKTIFQKKIVAKNKIENFFWISGPPENKEEGLYRISRYQLKKNFPELPPLIEKKPDLQKTGPTVSAFVYNSGRPRQIAIPPAVANVFFLPIPINSAGKDILSALPGIGPVLAERILQRREEQGAFRSKKDLLHVAGIGPKKFARLVDHITLE